VSHVDGVLVAARWLRRRGYERVFVPATEAAEAALVEGLEVIPCANLAGVVSHVIGMERIQPQPPTEPPPG
jgi:magnesium chelatase family protein